MGAGALDRAAGALDHGPGVPDLEQVGEVAALGAATGRPGGLDTLEGEPVGKSLWVLETSGLEVPGCLDLEPVG